LGQLSHKEGRRGGGEEGRRGEGEKGRRGEGEKGRRGEGEMYPGSFLHRAVREVGGNQKRSTKCHEIPLTRKYHEIALTKKYHEIALIAFRVRSCNFVDRFLLLS
jgi:hypothetical protein